MNAVEMGMMRMKQDGVPGGADFPDSMKEAADLGISQSAWLLGARSQADADNIKSLATLAEQATANALKAVAEAPKKSLFSKWFR